MVTLLFHLVSVFNVGEYRRAATEKYKSHEFFDHTNKEAMEVRQYATARPPFLTQCVQVYLVLFIHRKCALEALEDVCKWLDSGGEVAVFDATNTTRDRRSLVYDICTTKHSYKTFFVESVCTDTSIIEANVTEVKVTSPDYKAMDKEEAVRDFKQRIEHYVRSYEPLDEERDKEYSYIRIFNQGERFLVNRVRGE